MKESCKTCRFWEIDRYSPCYREGRERQFYGNCRWRPPVSGTDWAVTLEGEWCGRYVAKPQAPTVSDYR